MALSRRTLLAGLSLLPLTPTVAAARQAVLPNGVTAQRVVSFDLLLTEILLTLQIVPTAVGNIPLYQRLVEQPAVPAGVPDLGPLQEPNLELLQYLAPDLILAASWHSTGRQHFERIAPVAWLPTFSTEVAALDHAESLLQQVGQLVGREDVARTAVGATRATLEESRNRLAAYDTRPVFVVRFMEDGRHAAIFGGNGMIGDVLSRLGLTNAWTGRTNVWGVTSIGIEQLAAVPDARLIHFDRGAETRRALAQLADSPLWKALPFVRDDQVIKTPVVYPNGGVLSARRFARQLVQAFAAGTLGNG